MVHIEDLTLKEIDFFNQLLNYSPILHNGYYVFDNGIKRFKRSRVVMQLHLGKSLSIHEIVHHIDRDKTNDNLENLKIMSNEEHISLHHAGIKKQGHHNQIHRLSEEKILKIKKLGKTILKKDGTPNYSKIGRELGLCGFTVARHIKLKYKKISKKER